MSSAHYFNATSLKPFASAECFYDFDAAGLKIARAFFGSFLKIGAIVQLDACYLFQLFRDNAVWSASI